jgi:uncharacterized protein
MEQGEPTVGARRVTCPRCKGPALYAASNPWRPFCSERCSSIDLGAWASEAYRVGASDPPDGPAGDDPA